MKRGTRRAYRSNVAEQSSQIRNHSVHVLVFVDETMLLAVGDLADNIESEVLEPQGEVADFARCGVDLSGAFQEQLDDFVDEWLVLDECTHAKRGVD